MSTESIQPAVPSSKPPFTRAELVELIKLRGPNGISFSQAVLKRKRALTTLERYRQDETLSKAAPGILNKSQSLLEDAELQDYVDSQNYYRNLLDGMTKSHRSKEVEVIPVQQPVRLEKDTKTVSSKSKSHDDDKNSPSKLGDNDRDNRKKSEREGAEKELSYKVAKRQLNNAELILEKAKIAADKGLDNSEYDSSVKWAHDTISRITEEKLNSLKELQEKAKLPVKKSPAPKKEENFQKQRRVERNQYSDSDNTNKAELRYEFAKRQLDNAELILKKAKIAADKGLDNSKYNSSVKWAHNTIIRTTEEKLNSLKELEEKAKLPVKRAPAPNREENIQKQRRRVERNQYSDNTNKAELRYEFAKRQVDIAKIILTKAKIAAQKGLDIRGKKARVKWANITLDKFTKEKLNSLKELAEKSKFSNREENFQNQRCIERNQSSGRERTRNQSSGFQRTHPGNESSGWERNFPPNQSSEFERNHPMNECNRFEGNYPGNQSLEFERRYPPNQSSEFERNHPMNECNRFEGNYPGNQSRLERNHPLNQSLQFEMNHPSFERNHPANQSSEFERRYPPNQSSEFERNHPMNESNRFEGNQSLEFERSYPPNQSLASERNQLKTESTRFERNYILNQSKSLELQVCVVDLTDPEWKVRNDNFKQIEKFIAREIRNSVVSNPDFNAPVYKMNEMLNGHHIITCKNHFAVDFLKFVVGKMGELWQGGVLQVKDLRDLPTPQKLFVSLPDVDADEREDFDRIVMGVLHAQNPHLAVNRWRVVNKIPLWNSDKILVAFTIDQESKSTIEMNNCSLNYGVTCYKVRFTRSSDENEEKELVRQMVAEEGGKDYLHGNPRNRF